MFCLAIGHVEDDVGILDLLVEHRPPFSPAIVVEEMAATLGYYHLAEVTGDKFAAGFTVEAFAKCGVNYRYSDRSTSDYFAGFLPILNSRRCQLLDNKRLASQLCSLERRSARGGAKDSNLRIRRLAMTISRRPSPASWCDWSASAIGRSRRGMCRSSASRAASYAAES